MKRIGVFGSSANMGGTEMYLITIARLLNNDIKFDYLLCHNCGKIPFEDEVLLLGGRIYREYYYNREKKQSDYISPKDIINRHPEWDGIYLNIQRIHTAYRLIEAAKKVGMPYRIIHAHSNDYTYPIEFKDKLYEYYFKLTKQLTVTKYLACSKLAGEWMFGKNVDITIIPNAVDFKKYKINNDIRNKMRENYNISDKTILLGFCGRLSPQKRPEFLIDILNEMKKKPQYKLLIVGDGELMNAIHNRAVECKIEDRVIFVGAVRDAGNYYQMMDCFILPSRFEGFGIVLLEAQASGLRCYTTDQVVPYETNVTGRVTFLSKDANPSVWANSIETAGFDRKDCLNILEKSDYSLETMRKKLLNVFGITTEIQGGGGSKS